MSSKKSFMSNLKNLFTDIQENPKIVISPKARKIQKMTNEIDELNKKLVRNPSKSKLTNAQKFKLHDKRQELIIKVNKLMHG